MQMRSSTKSLSSDSLLDPTMLFPHTQPRALDDSISTSSQSQDSLLTVGRTLSRVSSTDTVATIEMNVEDDTAVAESRLQAMALNSSQRRGVQRCQTPVTRSPYPSTPRAPRIHRTIHRSSRRHGHRSERVYDHDWLSEEEEEELFGSACSSHSPSSFLSSASGDTSAHNRFQQSLSLSHAGHRTPKPLSSTRQAVADIRSEHDAVIGRAAKEMLTLFFSDEEFGKMLGTGDGQGFIELMERCKFARHEADEQRQRLFNAVLTNNHTSTNSTNPPPPSTLRRRPLQREPTMFLNSDGQWVDPRPSGHDPKERLFGSLKSPFSLSTDKPNKVRNLMGEVISAACHQL